PSILSKSLKFLVRRIKSFSIALAAIIASGNLTFLFFRTSIVRFTTACSNGTTSNSSMIFLKISSPVRRQLMTKTSHLSCFLYLKSYVLCLVSSIFVLRTQYQLLNGTSTNPARRICQCHHSRDWDTVQRGSHRPVGDLFGVERNSHSCG